MQKKKLCLIGGMGSGKSSLSRRYGALVGGTVVDTDKEFARRYGEISAFFAEYGEKEFRKREERLMIEAANSDACVIATGGGAVYSRQGMGALKAKCDVVWLTAPTEVLNRRIQKSDRPLRHDIVKLMQEREPLYRKYADYIIDSSEDSLRELKAALEKPRPRRYDILLCDADETLLDFSAACTCALKNTFDKLGISADFASARKAYGEVTDIVWHKLEKGEITRQELEVMRAELLSERIGIKLDPQRFNDTYVAEMQKTRNVLDGATRFLDECRQTGAKAYVVTNSYEKQATHRLKALDGHIDGYFISETVGYDKPKAEFFDAVINGIGCKDLSRVIMFGDSETSDVKGGVGYGLDTCLFDRSGKRTYGDTAADFIVRSYDEFLKLL